MTETGHRHGAALEEVHPETLDYLRPLLRRTIDTGEAVQLPQPRLASWNGQSLGLVPLIPFQESFILGH